MSSTTTLARFAAVLIAATLSAAGVAAGPGGFRKLIRRTTSWGNARPGRYRVAARLAVIFDQRGTPQARPGTAVRGQPPATLPAGTAFAFIGAGQFNGYAIRQEASVGMGQ